MHSGMIVTWESTMAINKYVEQLNTIEKFNYRDPEHELYSAYWVWTLMLTQQT